MEMMQFIRKTVLSGQVLLVVFLLVATTSQAQVPVNSVTLKKGKIYIALSKDQSPASIDSFIWQYQLQELDLKNVIKTNRTDSLLKLGFQVFVNNDEMLVVGRGMEPMENLTDPAEKILLAQKHFGNADAFNKTPQYGVNRFLKKHAFAVNDSAVTFYLKDFATAQKVILAGSFTNWYSNALQMTRVDSGWITQVKLGAGKHYYKFIVDGKWMVDKDNELVENDGEGNDNSVYYKTNYVFNIAGYTNARSMNLAGSFNNWNPEEIRMDRTNDGWAKPIYLGRGTHTYRFIADGNWFADKANPKQFPNEFGEFNSVVTLGQPHLFFLKGNLDAKKVFLKGSFNSWRDFELPMQKTDSGWILAYVLDKGNYEYNFEVDGKKPKDENTGKKLDNPLLVIEPNHSFKLTGYENARRVYLAGSFNNWSREGFAMRKTAEGWEIDQYLAPGKHLYKFVVDGKWIVDPANELQEPNEFRGQYNSVIWVN